jgi:cell division protein FtsB
MPNVDMSLIGALGAAVAALAGVVTYMGKWFVKQFDEVKAEVVECRKDRENLWKDRDKLWERIADLNDAINTNNGGNP